MKSFELWKTVAIVALIGVVLVGLTTLLPAKETSTIRLVIKERLPRDPKSQEDYLDVRVDGKLLKAQTWDKNGVYIHGITNLGEFIPGHYQVEVWHYGRPFTGTAIVDQGANLVTVTFDATKDQFVDN